MRRLFQAQWGVLGTLLIACAVLGGHLHTRLFMDEIDRWDARTYYKMATTPSLIPVAAPFAFRWLPHKLVPLVPLPAKRTYELVTWSMLLATSLCLYCLLRHTGLRSEDIVYIVVFGLLWAKWGGRFCVWYRCATEPLAYLLLVGGFCFAHMRRLPALAVVAILGAMCREQIGLLFPYYYLLHYGWRWDHRGFITVCVAALPAITVLLYVYWVTPITNSVSVVQVVHTHLMNKLGSPQGITTVLVCVATHAGLTVPLLAVLWRQTRIHMTELPHITFFIVANLAMGIFTGGDTDRLMFYAFPAELYLLCLVLRDAVTEHKIAWCPFFIAAMVGHVAISQTFAQNTYAANVFPLWNGMSCAIWLFVLLVIRRGTLIL